MRIENPFFSSMSELTVPNSKFSDKNSISIRNETLGIWNNGFTPLPSNFPGPSKFVGTKELGYFGLVSYQDLDLDFNLAAHLGIQYTGIENVRTDWLKFYYQGKVQFVAQKNLAYGMSWSNLNALGLIYGSKSIQIKGKKYKVRCMKSLPPNVSSVATDLYDVSTNPSFLHGSEWNMLMYRVSADAPTNAGEWASFSVNDLDVVGALGTISICQERVIYRGRSNARRIKRGGWRDNIQFLSHDSEDATPRWGGWRPVLEVEQ